MNLSEKKSSLEKRSTEIRIRVLAIKKEHETLNQEISMLYAEEVKNKAQLELIEEIEK